jgi:septum formation protein
MTLVLASQSPRRKQLLTEAGIDFVLRVAEVDEKLNSNLSINDQIINIAVTKAQACYQKFNNEFQNDKEILILSADTMVILDQNLLGKPKDQTEALFFLQQLSGRHHEVKTAVVLFDGHLRWQLSRIETAKVFFRKLSQSEIVEYVNTGEPMDKAGAYGVQGLGGKFISKIEGEFDNVMGLPIKTVKEMLYEASNRKNKF